MKVSGVDKAKIDLKSKFAPRCIVPLDSKAKMFIGRSSSISLDVSPQTTLVRHEVCQFSGRTLMTHPCDKLVPHL